jgi:nicotinamide mononucleotide (NMN) deamidase PncC
MNTEGVDYAVAFPGLNALQFTNTPNTGTVFFGLKPFDQRKHSAAEINARDQRENRANPAGLWLLSCRRRF